MSAQFSHHPAARLSSQAHEFVCRSCGHGSTLHASNRIGSCIVCAQMRSLRLPRRALCHGFLPDA